MNKHISVEYSTYSRMLGGLELAKYVLMRIVDNQSIEKISEDFDDDI